MNYVRGHFFLQNKRNRKKTCTEETTFCTKTQGKVQKLNNVQHYLQSKKGHQRYNSYKEGNFLCGIITSNTKREATYAEKQVHVQNIKGKTERETTGIQKQQKTNPQKKTKQKKPTKHPKTF